MFSLKKHLPLVNYYTLQFWGNFKDFIAKELP